MLHQPAMLLPKEMLLQPAMLLPKEMLLQPAMLRFLRAMQLVLPKLRARRLLRLFHHCHHHMLRALLPG
jgi:hypothetical protein